MAILFIAARCWKERLSEECALLFVIILLLCSILSKWDSILHVCPRLIPLPGHFFSLAILTLAKVLSWIRSLQQMWKFNRILSRPNLYLLATLILLIFHGKSLTPLAYWTIHLKIATRLKCRPSPPWPICIVRSSFLSIVLLSATIPCSNKCLSSSLSSLFLQERYSLLYSTKWIGSHLNLPLLSSCSPLWLPRTVL